MTRCGLIRLCLLTQAFGVLLALPSPAFAQCEPGNDNTVTGGVSIADNTEPLDELGVSVGYALLPLEPYDACTQPRCNRTAVTGLGGDVSVTIPPNYDGSYVF